MPTCLYCRETKGAVLFNREHVVPESFGRFRQNFVLKNVVCRDCNDYFGRTLDLKLAPETIEGLDRYKVGGKSPTGGTDSPGRSRSFSIVHAYGEEIEPGCWYRDGNGSKY